MMRPRLGHIGDRRQSVAGTVFVTQKRGKIAVFKLLACFFQRRTDYIRNIFTVVL